MFEQRKPWSWQDDLKNMEHEKFFSAWEKYFDLLKGDVCNNWMAISGGMSLANVKTEFELLALAKIAPNDLLFGLAHGKFADALAYPDRHDLELAWGETSPVHTSLARMVLAKGRVLNEQSSQNYSHFSENMTIHGSLTDMDILLKQVEQAPDEYCLGQITSWFLTARNNDIKCQTHQAQSNKP